MLTRRQFAFAGAAAGALVLLLGMWVMFGHSASEPEYAISEVARGTIERTVEATGKLEPQQLVSVGAQASGRLEQLNVSVGDVVHAGQLIGRIDAQTQTNSLETARAQLAVAQAQLAGSAATLARAKLAFHRQQIMGSGEATSRADFETAQADMRSAQASSDAISAQIRAARIQVQNARVQLGYTQVTAPMDGVVVAVVTKQGQTVNALQSAPTIVVLAKLEVMTIKAEISEADVINVHPGLPVYFTILGDPDRRYNARLRLVEPAPESIVSEVNSNSTNSTTGSSNSAIYYNALFEVSNGDRRLRALMTAKVTIELERRANVLTIPATALGTRGADGLYPVRVIDQDRRVTTRRVRVGLNNNVIAEAVSGLKAGEQVVVGEAASEAGKPQSRMGPPPV